jgi:FkbM family methyltransferase
MLDKGDSNLRFDYDLDSSSVIFDLGGFDGKWSAEIYARYSANIFIFEPVKAYYNIIAGKFKRNDKVHCFNFGLAEIDKESEISVDGIASSTYIKNKRNETIIFKNAVSFFLDNKIEKIDLMKINIEGGEYDLLDLLISSGFIEKINNIQVQFHSFVPNARARMENIQKQLSITHFPTYSYEFVFENWRLKEFY